MAGEALVKAGELERAVSVLTQGHTIAGGKGDLMPKNAMAKLLRELGAPVPDDRPGGPVSVSLSGADGAGPVPEGMMRCRQSGKIGHKMARPPFRGALGAWIGANISQETWNTWIGQGTKVINELRLDLSREKDQETYDQHMRDFLGIDEGVLAEIERARAGA
jgi:Fe-S cluster biosynthesis and repair protein YggX